MPKGGNKRRKKGGPAESKRMTWLRRKPHLVGPSGGLKRFQGHVDALLQTVVENGMNLSDRPGMKLRKLADRHGLSARLPQGNEKTAAVAHRVNWAACVRQLRRERRARGGDPLIRQKASRVHEARRRRVERMRAGEAVHDPVLDRTAPSAPWWPGSVRAEASRILTAGSPGGRFARIAARGLVHAIHENAAQIGLQEDHASFDADGTARSVYGRFASGERVRIADHPVHETPLRCTKRARFGEPRWDGEVIVEGAVWRWTMADVLNAAREAAATEGRRTYSTSVDIIQTV